ncbi:MAG: ATP synthase F0 subunit B [Acidobacteria bacterium]|nr:ATP synthase F0 subunit B [Acidobacteriota bacterium]
MKHRLRLLMMVAILSAAPLLTATPVQKSGEQAQAEPAKPQVQAAPPESAGQELAESSREAAGEEENAQFKYSPSVLWLARHTGLGRVPAYWLLISLNFAAIAILIGAFAKSKLPSFFRVRTQTIQMSMEEARRTSQEARARLGEIEARLSRIDEEVRQMRQAAESEGRNEMQRIQAAAEEDKARILGAVEQEVAAAQRAAERNLKAYAASLAVELAERRIRVDAETDRRLVRRFAEEFGENGSA